MNLRLVLAIIFFSSVPAVQLRADFLYFTDEAQWLAAVESFETLTTDANGIALANEVSGPPSQNQFLGSFLTFDSANTGFQNSFTIETLEAGAGFTFSDGEPSPASAGYENALSVGDIDNFENDDWHFVFTSGPEVTAFGFILRDNGDTGGIDILSIFDTNGNLIGTTDQLPSSTGTGAFVGVISTGAAIGSITYDEDASGDDIAIADFRFGTASIPEPSATFLAAGVFAFLFRRRKQV